MGRKPSRSKVYAASGKIGWTPWLQGCGEMEIERVWWRAKALHFPKDNVSHWYDGSELVGIEKWGFHGNRWCMKKPPADWKPMPPGYREEAERIWQAYRDRGEHCVSGY